jgi:hypothetical protein
MLANRPYKEINFIDSQYSILRAVARAPKATAAVVYTVPEMPVEMLLPAANIIFDEKEGYHKLKAPCFDPEGRPKYRQGIPEGVLSDEIVNNPVLLAPYLARAKALEEIIMADISVTIITPNVSRRRVDGKLSEIILPYGALFETALRKTTIIPIGPKIFNANKYDAAKNEIIPMVSSVWEDNIGVLQQAVVFESPKSVQFSRIKTDRLFGFGAESYIEKVDGLLKHLKQPTLIKGASPNADFRNLFARLCKKAAFPRKDL